jgi:hypothetical protein
MGKNINYNLRWGDLMARHVDEIQKVFSLKKPFLEKADKVIGSITQSFISGKKSKKKRKNVYIGIHLR